MLIIRSFARLQRKSASFCLPIILLGLLSGCGTAITNAPIAKTTAPEKITAITLRTPISLAATSSSTYELPGGTYFAVMQDATYTYYSCSERCLYFFGGLFNTRHYVAGGIAYDRQKKRWQLFVNFLNRRDAPGSLRPSDIQVNGFGVTPQVSDAQVQAALNNANIQRVQQAPTRSAGLATGVGGAIAGGLIMAFADLSPKLQIWPDDLAQLPQFSGALVMMDSSTRAVGGRSPGIEETKSGRVATGVVRSSPQQPVQGAASNAALTPTPLAAASVPNTINAPIVSEQGQDQSQAATPTASDPYRATERKFQFAAEKLAQQRACTAEPKGVLKSKSAGVEIYSIPCTADSALLISCSDTDCHVLTF